MKKDLPYIDNIQSLSAELRRLNNLRTLKKNQKLKY